MSDLETAAALVFGLCCVIVLIAAAVAIDGLVQSARRGNQQAQVMLVGIGTMALIVGFAWSSQVLWPAS